MRRLVIALILIATSATFHLSPTFASVQIVQGSLTGTLRDPDGRAVPGVNAVLSQSGKASRRGKTDASGVFVFADMPPGEYDFEASVAGFVKRYPVTVRADAQTQSDVLLQIGEVTEQMTVASWKGMAQTAPPPPQQTPASVQVLQPTEDDPCRSPDAFACLKPPVRIFDVHPLVPNGREGDIATVVIDGEIGIDGNMQSTRLGSSTDAQFASAALDAVRRWRFIPTRLNGNPVSTTIHITIKFVSR